MIHDLFQDSNPVFIAIQDAFFRVHQTSYPRLEVRIQELRPLRKLFIQRKLACYSLNNKTGKNGQYCALCSQRFRCQPRLRLMLLIVNLNQEPLPAILEIGRSSFDSLDRLLADVGMNRLPDTLVAIKVIFTERDHPAVEFAPL